MLLGFQSDRWNSRGLLQGVGMFYVRGKVGASGLSTGSRAQLSDEETVSSWPAGQVPELDRRAHWGRSGEACSKSGYC